MPVVVPGIMGALIPNLVSTGMIGVGVPKYALGIAFGLQNWVPKIRIQTVDAGTAGVGKGTPIPLIVLPPLLYTNLLVGQASQGLVGPLMPPYTLGLANGLALSFGQMLINTTHPSVGVGASVAKFFAPPAATAMLQGFKQAGLKGPATEKKAKAIGRALDMTFAVLVMPLGIVGPPSIVPSAGSGTGGLA